MIPMIDLLMVTISFLLITAVWTHMSRVNANAMVPGTRTELPPPPLHPEKQLHVIMQSEDRFVLVWKEGSVVVDSIDVPRAPIAAASNKGVVRYDDLAAKITSEWKAKGQHTNEGDSAFDQAVVHTDNRNGIQVHHRGHRRDLRNAPYAQRRSETRIGPRLQCDLFDQLLMDLWGNIPCRHENDTILSPRSTY